MWKPAFVWKPGVKSGRPGRGNLRGSVLPDQLWGSPGIIYRPIWQAECVRPNIYLTKRISWLQHNLCTSFLHAQHSARSFCVTSLFCYSICSRVLVATFASSFDSLHCLFAMYLVYADVHFKQFSLFISFLIGNAIHFSFVHQFPSFVIVLISTAFVCCCFRSFFLFSLCF